MGKTSLIFHKEWRDILQAFEPEKRLKFYEAIMSYSFEGTPGELTPDEMLAFEFLKRKIDSDTEAYEKRCHTLKLNGMKGGRPRKNQENQTKPNNISSTSVDNNNYLEEDNNKKKLNKEEDGGETKETNGNQENQTKPIGFFDGDAYVSLEEAERLIREQGREWKEMVRRNLGQIIGTIPTEEEFEGFITDYITSQKIYGHGLKKRNDILRHFANYARKKAEINQQKNPRSKQTVRSDEGMRYEEF